MKGSLIQKGHSHASIAESQCVSAARVILNKIPAREERRKLNLTEDELELLKKVISKFGD